MKRWLKEQAWLGTLAARCTPRRKAERRFILDDWAPFSYVVEFANRGPTRRPGSEGGKH